MRHPQRRPQHPERLEQAGLVRLLRSLGAVVYTLGTTRPTGDHQGTCQTPGLPDVVAFLKRPAFLGGETHERFLLVVEVKAKGGRLRPEQVEFQALCHAAGVAHVVGGIDAAIAWLIEHGFLRADQVGHYRQPAPETRA